MSEEDRGRRAVAFVGESTATYLDDGTMETSATLDDALHDAAVQAAAGGYGNRDLRVLSIVFQATPNPHIKELRVIVTPDA